MNLITERTDTQPKAQQKRAFYVLLGVIGLWIVVFAWFALLRHERLNSSAYDLAIKSQVIWNTYQGNWFASSIEVDHYLGDHVQLIMVLLAPLFGLWADVKILLIVQTILLGLAAIPVFRIAARALATPALPLAFALVYLLYPTVGFINRFGFHPISFVIFFLLMAYDLLETKRWGWASLFVLLALLCREDVGFTVFAFGLYAAFIMKQRCLGLTWAAAGLSWSLATIFVVIPHFRGADSDTLSRYAWLGGDLVGIVTAVFTHPLRVINHLMEPLRLEFLIKLLLPVGYLSLLAPLALLVALPALAYNLLSATPSQSSIYFQYLSPVIPFIMISAIQGAAKLTNRLPKTWSVRRETAVVAGWLALSVFVAWALDDPFTTKIDEPYFPVYALEQLTDVEAFHAAEALLPPEAEVATMMAYGPHLSLRPELHLFYDRNRFRERPFGFPQAEYLLLNLSDWRWGVNARVFLANVETAIGQFGYEAIFYENDVALLSQTGAPQPATGAVLQRSLDLLAAGGKFAPAAAETLAWHGRQWLVASLPETAVVTNLSFANSITLLGYTLNGTELAQGRPLCLTLYWQADAPIPDDLTGFMHLAAPDGYVHAQRDNAPAQGFYPTSQWQPGDIIADLRCLRVPPSLNAGEYGINVGLYDAATGVRVPLDDGAEDFVRITAVTVTPP